MEIVHAHNAIKLNIVVTNFQQKRKVNNPLQHIELDTSKMSIVTDVIYGEAVSYQKFM
jgi:hypothetical protein